MQRRHSRPRTTEHILWTIRISSRAGIIWPARLAPMLQRSRPRRNRFTPKSRRRKNGPNPPKQHRGKRRRRRTGPISRPPWVWKFHPRLNPCQRNGPRSSRSRLRPLPHNASTRSNAATNAVHVGNEPIAARERPAVKTGLKGGGAAVAPAMADAHEKAAAVKNAPARTCRAKSGRGKNVHAGHVRNRKHSTGKNRLRKRRPQPFPRSPNRK